jgi:hypothetical protein
MATQELGDRYGSPMSPVRRWAFIGVLASVVLVAVGWAAWYALTTGSPSLTWQDIGYQNTATGVRVTFEVTFDASAPASQTATCTVQAQNQVHTVVGTKDVRVGPLGDTTDRTVRMRTEVPTSETANTGLVSDCVLS